MLPVSLRNKIEMEGARDKRARGNVVLGLEKLRMRRKAYFTKELK